MARKRKSKRWVFLFVFASFLALFLFRHPVLEQACSIGLRYKDISFDSVSWEKDRLVIQNLFMDKESYQLTVDKVEIAFPHLMPHVFLRAPEVVILKNEQSKPINFFLPFKIDVEEGKLIIDENLFNFAFASGDEKDKIGTFCLSEADLENPLLYIDLEKQKEGVFAKMELKDADVGRILDLVALYFPQAQKISPFVEGVIDVKAEGFVEFPLNITAQVSMIGAARFEELVFPLKFQGSWPLIEGFIEEVPFSLVFEEGDIFQAKLEWEGQKIELDWNKTEGVVVAENLSSTVYLPVLKMFDKDLEMYGNLEITSKFNFQKAHLCMQSKDVIFNHPLFDCQGSIDNAEATIDFNQKSFSGKIPLRNSKIKEKSSSLVFDPISMDLEFDNKTFLLKNIQAEYEGLSIFAEGQMLVLDDDHAQLNIVTTKMEGSAAPLCQIAHYPFTGKILGKENGFCLSAQFSSQAKPELEWSFKGELREGKWESFRNLNFQVEIASHTEDILIRNVNGDFLRYPFFADQIVIKSQDILVKNIQVFDLRSDLTAHIVKGEESSDFAFTIESKNLTYCDAPFANVFLKGKKWGSEYLIENLKWAEYSLKGAAVQKKQNLDILQFELTAKDFQIQGDAQLNLETYHCTGLIREIAYKFKGFEGGGKIKGDFSLFVDKGKCIIEQLSLNLPDKILPFGQVNAQLRVEIDTVGFDMKGKINDGIYSLGTFSAPLKNITFKGNNKSFVLGCKTQYKDIPLLAGLQLDYGKEVLGLLRLQENAKDEGVKILFKPDSKWGMDIHSIDGVFCGLDFQVKKKSRSSFTGKVTFDGAKAAKLFPKMVDFQIGKGYCLEGIMNLDPLHFAGKLKGNHFSLLGYQMDEMHAEVEATKERIYIGNLHIKDKAGKIEIGQAKLLKDGEDWGVEIPSLQMDAFTPSLLTEENGSPKVIKPFFIKNLSLLNIAGNLNDLTSFKGSGHFAFTNQNKKEPHFLDVPLDIIKSFGLDLGLLTPVKGEIDLQLRGDKLYLTELREMYSEGMRSEFYLAPNSEDAYVDFKGNLHVDLKMRQDVALKITEPFVLNVRGTLKKPKYALGT